MAKKGRRNGSLRVRLIISMLIASLVPILILDYIMFGRYLSIIQNNVEELTRANLGQTVVALDTWIDSYGDIMYQLYSDEDVINDLQLYYETDGDEEIKDNMDVKLGSLLYTKAYIMAITIVTEEGDTFFHDRITPFSSHSFWINHYSMSMSEIYDMTVKNGDTTYFSTEFAKTVPSKRYYLFHMAHTMNYKPYGEDKKAVVIVSIDEQLLENICNYDNNENDKANSESLNFIVDNNGYVVAYADSSYLSTRIDTEGKTEEEKEQIYSEFVKESGVFGDEDFRTYIRHDDKLDWDIINVSSTTGYQNEISQVLRSAIILAILSALLVIVIIIFTIRFLMKNINIIVRSMDNVENGDTKERIRTTGKMPVEVATIAEHFNKMLDQLQYSMDNEKLLAERERLAEIAALEARINPHFLYNTLDTINWMAIDKDEVEISNAISALGKILRYGINDSNGIVTIATEMEWLKEYVYLQQTRLKDTFEFNMDVEKEVMDLKIHKLLFQPFVENSIIHGFAGKPGKHVLSISIKMNNDMLEIIISDNGVGMEPSQVDMINKGMFQHYDDKYHVGMENAFLRINLYYGKDAKVYVESTLGESTTVHIELPKEEV